MPCAETERLLNIYLAAIGDFYDAHKPSLTRWLRRPGPDITAATLLEARRSYWTHIGHCTCASREL